MINKEMKQEKMLKMKWGFLLAGIVQFAIALGQQTDSLRWMNPANNKFAIEGQAWGNEVQEPYNRLPARAQNLVRKQVWALSRNSTGIIVRFKTDAQQIIVRYTIKGALNLPHFPTTGFTGVDIYSVSKDGEWNWLPGSYSFRDTTTKKDTITYKFNIPKEVIYKSGREYRLYLPIYNTVGWMEIGTPKNSSFSFIPARVEKPIVIYGTSITQGGVASRAGMAWTSIAGRLLNQPLINLGFSGNGTLDKEMIDLISEIDAKVYVLDCLGNLMDTAKFPLTEVKRRIIESVKTLHAKHPMIPIILASFGAFNNQRLDKERGNAIHTMNENMKQAYLFIKASGISNVFILTPEEMEMGMDDTVDGNHATDLGMMHYATSFEKIFRIVLHEPIGDVATTIPREQYREDSIYNWENRNSEIIKLNSQSSPGVILLGSTIVHLWGGTPKDILQNTNNSWGLLEKAGIRNFGFSGDRIENILYRVEHGELEGYSSKKIIVMPGVEDLAYHTDDEIVKGIIFLLDAIKLKQPKTSLVFAGYLPVKGMESRIRNLNRKIVANSGISKIKYTDPGKLLLNSKGKINDTFYIDGTNLNEKGYRQIANSFIK
jgi:hypothetical protein